MSAVVTSPAGRGTAAWLLGLASGVRWRVAVLIVLLLGVTATYVGQGILIARALAGIFDGRSVSSLVPPLVGVVALVAVRAWLLAVHGGLALKASAAVKETLRLRLIDKLFELGPGWLQRMRTGTVQATVLDGVEPVDAYIGRFLPQCVAGIVGAIGVNAYVIVLDPLVGMIVLACVVATPLITDLIIRLIRPQTTAWWKSYGAMYADGLEAVQGMATLKSFNASRRRRGELESQAGEFSRFSIRLMWWWCATGGVSAFLMAVGTGLAVGIGAIHRVEGTLSTTELLIILMLTRECFRPLKELRTAYHKIWSFRASSKGMFELLDARPDVAEPPASSAPARVTPMPGVAFEELSFSYPTRSELALDRFSLDIAPGERVALVGRSGAGKTTVVSLLLRFFEPQHGRILIDTQGPDDDGAVKLDIRQLPLERLRDLVAVVSQDTYLFHGTVRDNLLLARPDATQDELEAAAGAARAHEFVVGLPQGYDTIVGERGLKLSGGERQRIAIARALLKDAPILVLDEATSNVDAANEASIQQALDVLSRGRTTLVIAHRLSTVRDANRVVVLDAGRVTETGDHARLLARQGSYARLVAAQEVPR